MIKLFRIALLNQKHRLLLIFTVLGMCFLTVASQLEILAIGVITKKGPDFFEMFAPEVDGQLQRTDVVTHETFLSRWDQIAGPGGEVITKEEAAHFLSGAKSSDVIQQVISFINQYFPITGNMRNLALALFFVAVFKAVALFAHRMITKVTAIRVSRDLRLKYFEHIQSLPMDFYQKYNIGSLSQRVVGDASMISEAVNACLVNYLQTPFTVISTMTLCFLTSWQLSLIVFLGFPLILFPISYISKHVRRISRQLQQKQEQFTSGLIDFLSGIQTVKIFSMEEYSLKKYKERNEYIANLERKSAKYDLSSRPVVHTIGMTLLSLSLVYGLYVLHMSVSETFFFCGLLYVFYEPIKKFAEQNGQIQRGIAAADRMFEVMEIMPDIVDEPGAEELAGFEGAIEFKNVGFRYADQWVLKDLSFTVNKGETVAIVGPTGAGKSTIVQLLPRLYDPQEGEVMINGKSIKSYTQKSLRDQIAFVPQKPFLFIDTVTENICYGQKFTPERVQTAARHAHAEEFITKLPQGFNTMLSEAGKNLSGGQQQRMAIARALVKDAPILVMDEATSALDTVSEKLIKKAIHELRGKVTQIIIAHRLSTIEDADKIIYLEEGKKIAEGTKEQLLSSCPAFERMWHAKFEVQHA